MAGSTCTTRASTGVCVAPHAALAGEPRANRGPVLVRAAALGAPGYLHPVWEASSLPSFATWNSTGGSVSGPGWDAGWEGGAPAGLAGL